MLYKDFKGFLFTKRNQFSPCILLYSSCRICWARTFEVWNWIILRPWNKFNLIYPRPWHFKWFTNLYPVMVFRGRGQLIHTPIPPILDDKRGDGGVILSKNAPCEEKWTKNIHIQNIKILPLRSVVKDALSACNALFYNQIFLVFATTGNIFGFWQIEGRRCSFVQNSANIYI